MSRGPVSVLERVGGSRKTAAGHRVAERRVAAVHGAADAETDLDSSDCSFRDPFAPGCDAVAELDNAGVRTSSSAATTRNGRRDRARGRGNAP